MRKPGTPIRCEYLHLEAVGFGGFPLDEYGVVGPRSGMRAVYVYPMMALLHSLVFPLSDCILGPMINEHLS